MYKFSVFKTAITGFVLCFASSLANAGVVLKTDAITGKLTGASGVKVGASLYSVEFVDGTCASVYGKCDNTLFPTNDEDTSLRFAEALLRDVFTGSFDLTPELTNGCRSYGVCMVLTPYAVDEFGFVLMSKATNETYGGGDVVSLTAVPSKSWTSSDRPSHTWARWSSEPTSAVPEPTSLALLAAAGAALTWSQRRRLEVKVVE